MLSLIYADLDSIQVSGYASIPDGCVICGEALDHMFHLECLRAELCMSPQSHHPFIPFTLEADEVEERSRIDADAVGFDGFPESWYSTHERPMTIDVEKRLSDIGIMPLFPESYRAARESLGLVQAQRLIPTFETIVDWPSAEYQTER